MELRDGTEHALHLTYPDTEPLTGRFFGFNNWEAKVTFDNLAVYDLSDSKN